ncbi:hypothetical protein ABIB06_001491 [Bradyrhizobium sp. LB8.2]
MPPPTLMSRTRRSSCAAAQSRDPGRHGLLGDMGPGSAAHRRRDAALRPEHRSGSSSHSSLPSQSHLRSLAAQFARALLRRSTLLSRRAQGRPGAGWHPRSAARKVAQGNRTAAYRCSQITRPSLRSGFTAYAVLSREPSSFWPPSSSRKSRTPRRLTQVPHPQRLDRSNDGQDHTVLPYARFAARRIISRRCRHCRKNTGETNLTAPLVDTKPQAHGEQSALPALSHPTLSRPPQARLYDHHDTWSPPRVSRDGRHIRQFRISVKWNIFALAD